MILLKNIAITNYIKLLYISSFTKLCQKIQIYRHNTKRVQILHVRALNQNISQRNDRPISEIIQSLIMIVVIMNDHDRKVAQFGFARGIYSLKAKPFVNIHEYKREKL